VAVPTFREDDFTGLGDGLMIVCRKSNKEVRISKLDAVRFGRWEIRCDADSTRKAYASVAAGGPEECGCQPCLNFAANRAQIYPAQVLALFEKLGVSPNREIEVYHLTRLPSGRHLYGGWFHFVGSILSGADAAKQVAENLWQPDLEEADENFSLGFNSRLSLVRKTFAGLMLVQLEFTAKVPWVLPSTEPT
jgi:hypothetical protein